MINIQFIIIKNMNKDKLLLFTLLLLAFLSIIVALFLSFMKKDASQLATTVKNKIQETEDDIFGDNPTNSDKQKKYTIGPTVILDRKEDPDKKGWTLIKNSKFNYSISLSEDFYMSNADIDKVVVYKNSKEDWGKNEVLVIFASLGDQIPDVMKDRYKYLEPGKSTDFEIEGSNISRLKDFISESGASFKVYEIKRLDDKSKTFNYRFYDGKLFVHMSFFIEENGISEAQIKEIISTFKLQ